MTSGQDVSEYLDTFGLVKSYFFKFFEKMQLKKIEKKSGKKMSWCSDAPEDEAISLFAGLLANPDMTLSPTLIYHFFIICLEIARWEGGMTGRESPG
jgi:hypothetical protein